MLITIEKVLTAEQVAVATQKLATAEWVDGRVTAGYQAQEVKRNAQIPENSPVAKELGEMILAGLARSPRFMSAALPLRVFPPMFNSYAGGQDLRHACRYRDPPVCDDRPAYPHRPERDIVSYAARGVRRR